MPDPILISHFLKTTQHLSAANKLPNRITYNTIRDGFNQAIRTLTDYPWHYISIAAINFALSRNSNPQVLFDLKAPQRTGRYGSGDLVQGKVNLIWEHANPVQDIFNGLNRCTDEDQIEKYLITNLTISLITALEDQDLTDAGFRNNQPRGWEEAYETCKIKLMSRAEFEERYL